MSADNYYGKSFVANLCCFAGEVGTVLLDVRTVIRVGGPRSDYVVHKNGKVWHESRGDLEDAMKAYHEAIKPGKAQP
jgi:hypothetical protein